MPTIDELELEEPEVMRQGGRYGIKLKANAPSIHMFKVDIESTVSPIVGNEKQSEDMVNYLLEKFSGEPAKIWESNIFGRSFHELVNEDLQAKLYRMPMDARLKFQCIEEIEFCTTHINSPKTRIKVASRECYADRHPVTVLVAYWSCRDLHEVLSNILCNLLTMCGKFLVEISESIEKTYSYEVGVHI